MNLEPLVVMTKHWAKVFDVHSSIQMEKYFLILYDTKFYGGQAINMSKNPGYGIMWGIKLSD